jgi:hypothetical protein
MVPAYGLLLFARRGTAEFTAPDDERLIQQSPPFEVFYERRGASKVLCKRPFISSAENGARNLTIQVRALRRLRSELFL